MADLVMPNYHQRSSRAYAEPAPRRRAGLRRVLLFDNGRLAPEFGQYEVIFDELERRVRSELGEEVAVDRTSDRLSARGVNEIDVHVQTIRERGYDAVVIALCDIGVSQPSVLLASRLEEQSIPCCLMSIGAGTQFIRESAASMRRRLAVVPLTTYRTASRDAVRDEAAARAGEVLSAILDELPAEGSDGASDEHAADFAAVGSDGDLSGDFTEQALRLGLSDGLPLVAPTRSRVAAALHAMGRSEDEVIWPALPPRTEPVTAADIAALGVMAGCLPEHLWAVEAAYRSMIAPEFGLTQAAITTHPTGTLVLVTGPRAQESGIASAAGCLGPGYRANAAIGRAVALSGAVFLDSHPGRRDLTRQGSPAEYSYCCAENTVDSPWEGLSAVWGHPDETAVTVLKCEGPRAVLDQVSTTPESLVGTLAGTLVGLGSGNSYNPSAQCMVFLNPEHANLIAAAGWCRADVQKFIYENARIPRSQLHGRGSLPHRPPQFDMTDPVPIVCDPADVIVAVVGAPGPQSQVAVPWGYSRGVTTFVP